MVTRRTVLRNTAAIFTISTLSTSVVAQSAYGPKPTHVTLDGYSDIPSKIEKFQPLLVLRDLEIRPSKMYAWRASSPNYEYDWYCYWVFYQAQRGATEADSHLPDREPIYVAVDPETEAVEKTIWDQDHYLAAKSDRVPLYRLTHPKLYVINPWHPYSPTQDEGEFADLDDMHDVYESWIENGWGVHKPAVVDPPTIEARGHWWPDTTFGISVLGALSPLVPSMPESIARVLRAT